MWTKVPHPTVLSPLDWSRLFSDTQNSVSALFNGGCPLRGALPFVGASNCSLVSTDL